MTENRSPCPLWEKLEPLVQHNIQYHKKVLLFIIFCRMYFCACCSYMHVSFLTFFFLSPVKFPPFSRQPWCSPREVILQQDWALSSHTHVASWSRWCLELQVPPGCNAVLLRGFTTNKTNEIRGFLKSCWTSSFLVQTRLQNSRFFLTISKEVPDLLFHCLVRTWIRQNTDCFAV